jgi:tryptophanyl-tRNA synthetase
VELQNGGRHEVYVLIADGQALTDNWTHPKQIRDNITEVVMDYLAVGLDPSKATIMLQTAIPELTELAFYYLNLVTLSRLERNPTVKTEIADRGFENTLPMGFLCYPVSQAADITAFQASCVPVGEDQLPMIEQTREIVRSFNRVYGQSLVEPEGMLSDVKRLPGTDGASKMSKSAGNCIYLKDEPDAVAKKVKRMYTDPTKGGIDAPGSPERNPVYQYLAAFDPDTKGFAELRERYRAGGVQETEGKKRLTDVLLEMLKPIRERRKKYSEDIEQLRVIVRDGTERGRALAAQTVQAVRSAMCLNFLQGG